MHVKSTDDYCVEKMNQWRKNCVLSFLVSIIIIFYRRMTNVLQLIRCEEKIQHNFNSFERELVISKVQF
jgi:hypothetical protein